MITQTAKNINESGRNVKSCIDKAGKKEETAKRIQLIGYAYLQMGNRKD